MRRQMTRNVGLRFHGRSKGKDNAAGEREVLCVALQCAASFHCLVEAWKDCEELRPKLKEKWFFLETKSENAMHRTEWCAEADKYQCVKC